MTVGPGRWWPLAGVSASVAVAVTAGLVWALATHPVVVVLAPSRRAAAVRAPAPAPTSTAPGTARPSGPRRAARAGLVGTPPLSALEQGVTSSAPVPTAPPVALSIPAIGVHAHVVAESLGEGRSLVIPPPAEVGWYAAGPAPGQEGTTLVAGHIDDNGVVGAFLRLSAAQLGDRVALTTATGRRYVYRVAARRLVPQADFATRHLVSASGPPRLLLVSCGGPYDPATHLYQDNVVITASQVSPPVG